MKPGAYAIQSMRLTFDLSWVKIGFNDRMYNTYEPRWEKNGLRGLRPGPTQTGLYSRKRWLEASNFVFRKRRYCTIRVAKTKVLISFAVTAKVICVFVFAYAKIRFSHDAAHMYILFR